MHMFDDCFEVILCWIYFNKSFKNDNKSSNHLSNSCSSCSASVFLKLISELNPHLAHQSFTRWRCWTSPHTTLYRRKSAKPDWHWSFIFANLQNRPKKNLENIFDRPTRSVNARHTDTARRRCPSLPIEHHWKIGFKQTIHLKERFSRGLRQPSIKLDQCVINQNLWIPKPKTNLRHWNFWPFEKPQTLEWIQWSCSASVKKIFAVHYWQVLGTQFFVWPVDLGNSASRDIGSKPERCAIDC